jgi:cell wall-associated NlpC family hydrolase
MGRSDADIARLEDAARAWEGTPFVHNSAVRGLGVCCHRLIGSVLVDAGWLPPMEFPTGAATAPRWAQTSVMAEWFAGPGAEWFDATDDAPQPGDVLLLRTGHAAHHLALVLTGDRVMHATITQGAHIRPMVPAMRRLLVATYRPKNGLS